LFYLTRKTVMAGLAPATQLHRRVREGPLGAPGRARGWRSGGL